MLRYLLSSIKNEKGLNFNMLYIQQHWAQTN